MGIVVGRPQKVKIFISSSKDKSSIVLVDSTTALRQGAPGFDLQSFLFIPQSKDKLPKLLNCSCVCWIWIGTISVLFPCALHPLRARKGSNTPASDYYNRNRKCYSFPKMKSKQFSHRDATDAQWVALCFFSGAMLSSQSKD